VVRLEERFQRKWRGWSFESGPARLQCEERTEPYDAFIMEMNSSIPSSLRRRRRLCAYCGQERELTRDHVPPRTLFSKPFPDNIPTVPACSPCNASFKKDDEYSQTVLSIDFKAAGHRDVLGGMSTMARALSYPQAHGFMQSLLRNSRPTGLLTPSGARIGALTIDVPRINATGEHIVRGLHYLETGKPIDPKAKVVVNSIANWELSNPLILAAVRMHDLCGDKRLKEVGKAFSYGIGLRDDKSVWIMLLYGCHLWNSCGWRAARRFRRCNTLGEMREIREIREIRARRRLVGFLLLSSRGIDRGWTKRSPQSRRRSAVSGSGVCLTQPGCPDVNLSTDTISNAALLMNSTKCTSQWAYCGGSGWPSRTSIDRWVAPSAHWMRPQLKSPGASSLILTRSLYMTYTISSQKLPRPFPPPPRSRAYRNLVLISSGRMGLSHKG
jgi:hypothetical protein